MTAPQRSNDIVEGEETGGVPGRSGRHGVRAPAISGEFFFFWEEVARTDIFRLKSLIEEILRSAVQSLENPPERRQNVRGVCFWLLLAGKMKCTI